MVTPRPKAAASEVEAGSLQARSSSGLGFHVRAFLAAPPSSQGPAPDTLPGDRAPCPAVALAGTSASSCPPDHAPGLSPFVFSSPGVGGTRAGSAPRGPGTAHYLGATSIPQAHWPWGDLGLESLSHAHTPKVGSSNLWRDCGQAKRETQKGGVKEGRKVAVALGRLSRAWKGTYGSRRGR